MLFFIYGTDAYRCQEKLKELKSGFIQKRDKSGLNVVALDGEKLEFDRLRQEILTPPFLGDKKMIIVKNLFRHLTSAAGKKLEKQLVEFIKTNQDKLSNVLCFVEILNSEKFAFKQKTPLSGELFKLLSGQKFAWRLDTLAPREMKIWLKKYLAEKKAEMTSNALDLLLSLISNDLNQIVIELQKLIAYKKNNTITEDDVKALVRGGSDDNIFNLVDAIGQKNKKVALALIASQKQNGTHELLILKMIARQFKILFQIKDGATSATVGLPPFIFKRALAQAENFSAKTLLAINQSLLDLEKSFKTGARNPELLLDLFVSRYC